MANPPPSPALLYLLYSSFAPWCSACKQFASTWESFGDWASESDVDVRVGKVDVTTESSEGVRVCVWM